MNDSPPFGHGASMAYEARWAGSGLEEASKLHNYIMLSRKAARHRNGAHSAPPALNIQLRRPLDPYLLPPVRRTQSQFAQHAGSSSGSNLNRWNMSGPMRPKAPPPSAPPLRVPIAEERSGNVQPPLGFVHIYFHNNSSGELMKDMHGHDLIIQCNFDRRWHEVLAEAQKGANQTLRILSPSLSLREHVRVHGSRTIAVPVDVLPSPPSRSSMACDGATASAAQPASSWLDCASMSQGMTLYDMLRRSQGYSERFDRNMRRALGKGTI